MIIPIANYILRACGAILTKKFHSLDSVLQDPRGSINRLDRPYASLSRHVAACLMDIGIKFRRLPVQWSLAEKTIVAKLMPRRAASTFARTHHVHCFLRILSIRVSPKHETVQEISTDEGCLCLV